MQNVLTVVVGYLGKISLPGLGVIGMDQIYTCIYPSEGHFDRPWIYPGRIYLQNEYDPLDLPEPG